MMHHGFDDDEEVVVLNREILKVSGGLRDGRFPKRYAIQHRWYMRVAAVLMPLFILSPKVISALLDEQTPTDALSLRYNIWGGAYIYFAIGYCLIFFSILLFKIPWSIERERQFFTIHFLLRSVRIPIDDVEELRMVRCWTWKDSMRVAQRTAGTACGGSSAVLYEEVGPKKPVVKCIAAACCHPMDFFKIFSSSKIFWGSPFNCGRSTCALSVRGSPCENFIFCLADIREFARDNRPDYNCVPPIADPSPLAEPSFPEPPKIFAKGTDLEHQPLEEAPPISGLMVAVVPTKFGKPQEVPSPATTVASSNFSPTCPLSVPHALPSPPSWQASPLQTPAAGGTPATGFASPWPVVATAASYLQGLPSPLAQLGTGTCHSEMPQPQAALPDWHQRVVPKTEIADAFAELHAELQDSDNPDFEDARNPETNV